MADEPSPLPAWLKSLGGDWKLYTVIGSFALYVAGYLSLRFHVTALGVVTDHAVLDERYVFEGAKFLVYLSAAVPSMAILVGPPLALLVWTLARRRSTQLGPTKPAVLAWVAVGGIAFAVLAIQFLMRQCFSYADLLLADAVANADTATGLALLHRAWRPAWFVVLVGTCVPPAAALWMLARAESLAPSLRFARLVLGAITMLQCLLLPINHGIVVDTNLPRLWAAGSRTPEPGETVWLVWEGKQTVTFLLRTAVGRRSLLTVPRDQAKELETVAMDDIVAALFRVDGTLIPPKKTP